jgi:DNA-directed RNA polymerase specialized sigma24 family protein
MVAEEFRLRLEGLKDDSLRQVALMRMEGYANEEIAARLDISLRSVERKLDAIRKRWKPEDLR